MSMRICIESANHMKMFCYVIPPVPTIPVPGPVPHGDPQPHWAAVESIPETVQRELSTIAAIDRLADGLPSDIRESVRKTIRASAQAHPGVPKGMTVGF